jgi:hypothetical protein
MVEGANVTVLWEIWRGTLALGARHAPSGAMLHIERVIRMLINP